MKAPLLKLVLASAVAVCWLLTAPIPLLGNSSPDEFEIVAFKHILSIEPGYTKYSEAIKLLGKPEKIQTSEERVVAGVKSGGHKIVSYPSRGIFFLISKEDLGATDPVIGAISVEPPFNGTSPNGLHLGMSKNEALEICDRDYFRTTSLDTTCFFAAERGGDGRFQLWFTDGRVSRMKIFAPLKSK